MKVHYEVVNKRREQIMMLIQKFGSIEVDKLANEFGVSALTIRRDLQYWEEKGAIVRYHGGAKLVQSMFGIGTPSYLSNERYKHAIAKYAAQYVENNDTIFINTSSTALLVIQYIINKRVTIITNNAKALMSKHDPLVSIFLTGGELRFPKEAMIGEFALNNLSKVTANKVFLGCSGIDVTHGVTTAILQEVAINETMIARAGQVFVLADYTKVGENHRFTSGLIEQVDYLVTDVNADKAAVQSLKESGVTVVELEPINFEILD